MSFINFMDSVFNEPNVAGARIRSGAETIKKDEQLFSQTALKVGLVALGILLAGALLAIASPVVFLVALPLAFIAAGVTASYLSWEQGYLSAGHLIQKVMHYAEKAERKITNFFS